uniref:DYW domain-containing protein n=1 Tax=Leersia perrieri TaxID=77586 RepID=A0A0D9UYZ1_9ORYZ
MKIHASTVKIGLERDVFVRNSLVVMYLKCSSICKPEALEIFQDMNHNFDQPDQITYIGLHARMLVKGRYFSKLLEEDPSVDLKHCSCMVDAESSGNLKTS